MVAQTTCKASLCVKDFGIELSVDLGSQGLGDARVLASLECIS